MKLNVHSRTWHIWVSTLLALPILVVALTTVFIAHKKALATDEVQVAAGWLPGYRTANTARNEPRASLTTTSGATWIGTTGGLYRLDGERLVAVEDLAATPVRALAEAAFGRVVAARNGVWLQAGPVDAPWRRALKGDAWYAAARPDGTLAVIVKDKGLLVSADGKHWQGDERLAAALAALPADSGGETITLARLVMDLHTGKAFFGKDGEWVWIDLVGLALCLLALTGVYMWWRGQRRRAALPARSA